MDSPFKKRSHLQNLLLRLLSFAILLFLFRFSFLLSSNRGVSSSSSVAPRDSVSYHFSLFQDLLFSGFLSPDSDVLCVESLTQSSSDVTALIELGVRPVVSSHAFNDHRLPFDDDSFDFVFSGNSQLDHSILPLYFASEIGRTLKNGGIVVIHTKRKDLYSSHSILDLFDCCRLIRARDIAGPDPSVPSIREIILKKLVKDHDNRNNCTIPDYKRKLIEKVEPLIEKEPLKPWITLKRNLQNIKYLPLMVDISFKLRYVYIDVGGRSYGSSIGSWFKKRYPKQNKTFEVYAIEADKAFHGEYRLRKGVTLLPYAAWVRNETLFFEINREPNKKKVEEKGRGMGRIQPVQSSANFMGNLDKIRGFDFADWLVKSFTKRDFVVVKMDVEGTEFHLIPRLIETGAICLIDEMFVECHYSRWQRCCPGVRSPKYQKTYEQCLGLVSSLREMGVLVHQWW